MFRLIGLLAVFFGGFHVGFNWDSKYKAQYEKAKEKITDRFFD